jgi:hypothetical protein
MAAAGIDTQAGLAVQADRLVLPASAQALEEAAEGLSVGSVPWAVPLFTAHALAANMAADSDMQGDPAVLASEVRAGLAAGIDMRRAAALFTTYVLAVKKAADSDPQAPALVAAGAEWPAPPSATATEEAAGVSGASMPWAAAMLATGALLSIGTDMQALAGLAPLGAFAGRQYHARNCDT